MIEIIITLAIVGFIVWLIVTYVPMPPIMKNVIIAVAVVCVVFYLLRAFGVYPGHDVGVPNLQHDSRGF